MTQPDRPYTDADVEAVAEVIAELIAPGMWQVPGTKPAARDDARAVLDALTADGRWAPVAEVAEHIGERIAEQIVEMDRHADWTAAEMAQTARAVAREAGRTYPETPPGDGDRG